ncbi:MAG TPA: alanyl-tRNA editing protein [Longimicrobiales bacterium]|nr:alanyl-tRNA editing protein [Longimicrobiales bacterium]
MTERLYYTDAYLRAFDAVVADAADGGRRIYLDRTAFYPTSGGQPCDAGTLGGVPVVDVVDEGERIAHVLAAPLGAEVGATVEGLVDWARRFDHMQQHTGQHLLSAVFADLYGLETVSVHFGATSSTLDLRAESVDRETLLAAEARANAVVWEDRPVTVTFEDAAATAGLRKPSERPGELRVVSIEGVDRSACGGTHVARTAEIGPVLLRRSEKIRKETRIEFLCGARALGAARADWETLGRVAQALSTAPEEAPALVAGLRDQLKDAASARRRLEEELAGHRARDVWERTVPGPDGVRRAVERRGAGGMDELRALAHAFVALPRAVLIGAVSDPPSVLLAASEDSGLDAGAELRRVLADAGGRGGGSARIAQGSTPGAEALERVVVALTA